MKPTWLNELYPFKSNFFEIEANKLHYVDEGEKSASPILMVHGNPTWSFYYRDLIKERTFKFPYGLTDDNEVIYDQAKRDKLSKKIKLGDILLSNRELNLLEIEAEKSYTISEKLWAGHQRRKAEHKTKGNGFGYSSFNAKSQYTSTISARYYKDGSEILIEQKGIKGREDRPRKIHPIEAARLQGYPIDDWYELPVSDSQAYKQFGNSVSVPVVTTLAGEILNQLIKS